MRVRLLISQSLKGPKGSSPAHPPPILGGCWPGLVPALALIKLHLDSYSGLKQRVEQSFASYWHVIVRAAAGQARLDGQESRSAAH